MDMCPCGVPLAGAAPVCTSYGSCVATARYVLARCCVASEPPFLFTRAYNCQAAPTAVFVLYVLHLCSLRASSFLVSGEQRTRLLKSLCK